MTEEMDLILVHPSKEIEEDAVKYKKEHFDYGICRSTGAVDWPFLTIMMNDWTG